jgi:hypothetical protein
VRPTLFEKQLNCCEVRKVDNDDDAAAADDDNKQRMWNVKTAVIPVIIGATGTILKAFRKYVRNIPGHNEVKELQSTAILGTTHILRKVLT